MTTVKYLHWPSGMQLYQIQQARLRAAQKCSGIDRMSDIFFAGKLTVGVRRTTVFFCLALFITAAAPVSAGADGVLLVDTDLIPGETLSISVDDADLNQSSPFWETKASDNRIDIWNDGDGLVDAQAANTLGFAFTGLGAGGCSIGSTAAQSRDPLIPLMLLVALWYVMSCKLKALYFRCASTALLVAALVSGNVQAADLPGVIDSLHDEAPIDRRFYAGMGVGTSSLEPDTSELDEIELEGGMQPGVQLALGMDFSKWFSAELHASQLGAAQFDDGSSINYQSFGASAIVYAGANRGNYLRQGLTGFGRLGYGYLRNEQDGDVRFIQENETHVIFGLGMEYTGRRGLGARAEAVLVDEDAQYFQLGLVYRFNRTTSRSTQLPALNATQPSTTVPVTTAVAVVPQASIDVDNDGVEDQFDGCPDTMPDATVDSSGCALFDGVLDGVDFDSGSATLTQSAMIRLREAAATIERYPNNDFVVAAHTDTQGDAAVNLQLSRQRVIAVGRFLTRLGIPVSRLTLKAYGETRPLVANTSEGARQKNRRIELYRVK